MKLLGPWELDEIAALAEEAYGSRPTVMAEHRRSSGVLLSIDHGPLLPLDEQVETLRQRIALNQRGDA